MVEAVTCEPVSAQEQGILRILSLKTGMLRLGLERGDAKNGDESETYSAVAQFPVIRENREGIRKCRGEIPVNTDAKPQITGPSIIAAQSMQHPSQAH